MLKKRKKNKSTKNLKVDRSYIYAHAYRSRQNPKYGDGRDIFPVVWLSNNKILKNLKKNIYLCLKANSNFKMFKLR